MKHGSTLCMFAFLACFLFSSIVVNMSRGAESPSIVNAFGDSITVGGLASDDAHKYANIIAASQNWILNNQAISGSEAADIAHTIFGTSVSSTENSFYLPGYNDMRRLGGTAQALEGYEKKVKNYAAWLTTTNKFRGQDTANITYTGSWNDAAIYSGVANLTRYSYTQNDTAQATISGRTIYIGYTAAVGFGSQAAFRVMIDGTIYADYISYAALDTISSSLGYAPFLIRIPNLADGPHSVLITVISGTDAVNKVYLDWIGGSRSNTQTTGPVLYLGNTLRMNSVGYTLSPPYGNHGSDEAVASYNVINKKIANELASDNLNIIYVDANAYYNLATDVYYDNLHPNDTGHQHIAQAFLDAMNEIELRQTGQTASFGTGDDGAKRRGTIWPSPRFLDNADNTVTDKLTGLVWTKNGNLPGGERTWQQALDYVASMNSGTGTYGRTDWRVPTVNELQSLINAQQPNVSVWLNSNGGFGNPFINVQNGYWSSTSYAGASNFFAWFTSMNEGGLFPDDKEASYYYVWPVRAGQTGPADWTYPANVWKTGQISSYDENIPKGDDGALQAGVSWHASSRFNDNGNGTITDNLSGLVWLKDAACFGSQSWTGALAAANNLASGQCGLTDGSSAGEWSLPNKEELHSLIDFSMFNPALSSGHPFINVSAAHYWSSTTLVSNATAAWYCYMGDGSSWSFNKTSSNYYAWPVRAGIYGNPNVIASPNSTDFGAFTPGSSSSAQTFTITNSGTNNLYIGAITLTGANPDNFSIPVSSDGCSNKTVAPEGTCNINIVFSPISGGAKSAWLSIPSNAPSNPYTVSLVGTGLYLTLPVRRVDSGGGTTGYLTIQDAYNAASNGDTIQIIQSADLYEDLILNGDLTLSIYGGYDTDFNTVTGFTIVHGSMIIGPGPGSVSIENLILQ